ncbi:hypothetical protein K438DRAFT_1974527 [Mycena galopus ATCC 62051]|nr:hypothetical protein K438DRAFT_1974527 [Mycena galopus ATCC 62051]
MSDQPDPIPKPPPFACIHPSGSIAPFNFFESVTIPLALVTGNTLFIIPSERDAGATMIIADLRVRKARLQILVSQRVSPSTTTSAKRTLFPVHGNIGSSTGIGTFTPICPPSTLISNRRTTAPKRVNTAAPFPNRFVLSSAGTRITHRAGAKISSLVGQSRA